MSAGLPHRKGSEIRGLCHFMFYVYILFSESNDQFYCGQTDNIDYRLEQHNSGETESNKHGIPWLLVGYLMKETRSEAMILERQIKKRGMRRWLDKNYEELIKPNKRERWWMSR